MLFHVNVGYPHQIFNKHRVPASWSPVSCFESRGIERARARWSLSLSFFFFPFRAMSHDQCVLAFFFGLLAFLPPRETHCATNVTDIAEQVQAENALAKLVKMFSKPGAFKRVSRGMSYGVPVLKVIPKLWLLC